MSGSGGMDPGHFLYWHKTGFVIAGGAFGARGCFIAGGAFGTRGCFIWADKIAKGNRLNKHKIIFLIITYILIRRPYFRNSIKK